MLKVKKKDLVSVVVCIFLFHSSATVSGDGRLLAGCGFMFALLKNTWVSLENMWAELQITHLSPETYDVRGAALKKPSACRLAVKVNFHDVPEQRESKQLKQDMCLQ